MNSRNKLKIYDNPFTRYIKIPFFVLLAALAVMTGIQAGNIFYRLDIHLVDRIDSENFKDTINSSFPIIENIYNSGKSSASFVGEIKNLFTGLFEFNLDSPVTILNVQSPLFKNYYDHEYKSMLSLNSDESQPKDQFIPDDGDSGSPGSGSNNGEENSIGNGSDDKGGNNAGKDSTGENGTGSNSTGSKDNSGDSGSIGNNDSGNTTDSSDPEKNGNINESGAGNGKSSGNDPDSNITWPDTSENGQMTKEGNGDKAGTATPPPSDGNIDLEPISSIAYEAEDEEDDKDSDMVALDKMVIKNYTKHKIDIAKLLKEPLKLDLSKKGPKVLVYHTHSSESYVLKEEDLGKKNVPSFNSNPKYSVVRVGEELSRNLRKYGIDTLHNGTVHDKVRDAAYGVAINTLKSYVKSYPSIKVYIDIHRDAVSASKPKLRMVKKLNGKNTAQIMFVMGTNDLLPHPDWEKNLQFALKVQQKLNEKYPGLAKPVMIVGKRYNQQVSDQAVLIEVGGDGNLLSECLESTKYLAEALNEVMKGK